MGRTQRDKAPFAFGSKKISMYRPTSGQAASFALAVKSAKASSDQMRMVTRFFGILESLVVRKADWEWMEDQLMTGASDIPAYGALLSEVFSHEWPEAEAESDTDEPDAGE